VSDGLVARLRAPLAGDADLGEVLAGPWASLEPGALARRQVYLGGMSRATFGDLFDVTGHPGGRIQFSGDLSNANRLGAGLAEGEVVVEGSVGADVGTGMSGGAIDVQGSAGPRAGGAAPEARRGMTGGELVVRGSVGPEAGTRMRRGLLVVGGNAGTHAGAGTIAGTIVVFGDTGVAAGLWSKRGSIVALGAIAIPSTYAYACTYRPTHVRLLLGRLKRRYGIAVQDRHLAGAYRRFSGDLADLGKGEILEWTAE
jgi:formylmethanofuran dehydrogenase subunit C